MLWFASDKFQRKKIDSLIEDSGLSIGCLPFAPTLLPTPQASIFLYRGSKHSSSSTVEKSNFNDIE
jgi:hypothetical protein